ncbi:MAG: GumC family protein [Devosia sp.]
MTLDTIPADDLRMDARALFAALWARALRIVIVTVLLLAATFAVLLFVPKQYESSSSLLVEDRSNAITQGVVAPPTSTGGGVSIDALLSSQIELIKSRDTLLAVAEALDLKSIAEFNGSAGNPFTAFLALIGRKPEPRSVEEAVLQALNDRLTVIRERDSAVISIFARSADPQLAAKLANTIADQHVKRRTAQSLADNATSTAWLQQQIESLRKKVQDDDTKVADYKSQNGIFAGSNGTTLPDQQISDVGKQITDAQVALNTARQHADLIRTLLKSGQPVEGVDDVRNSPSVQGLLQSRATLQSTLAEKLATLLPGHPTIIALNAQIAQINKQVQSEARHVAEGLDAQATAQTGLIAALNDDLKRAQLAASTQTKDSVTLDSLVREATADRDLLNTYLLKYRDAAGRSDAGSVLPDVRVVAQAAPSMVPASPKTALILGAVGFVALVLQIGMVLFGELMSGRAVYDRTQVDRFTGEADEPVDDAEAYAEPHLDSELEQAVADGIEPDEFEEQPEPIAATVVPQTHHRAAAEADLALSNLSADMTLGRVRVLLLAGVSEGRDAAIVADAMVREALAKGLSVCRVDAGSGRVSMMPGLTDLTAEQVSYGDIVHKVRDGLAEVQWGQNPTLDRRSMRPLTLLEALADIYEVVVISTGRVGVSSSLSLFAGCGGRLVLVRRRGTPRALADAVAADAASLGFELVETVMAPEPETAVA